MKIMKFALHTLCAACAALSFSATALEALRINEPITLDGKLSESAWARAKVFDEFYESMPKEKIAASVKTEVRMLYDSQALYVGIRAFDPQADKITAPFVRRDKVFGTQESFVVWIDPTGARKFAQFFRVNAIGGMGDGIWNEDQLDESFAPDYDFDAQASIDKDGWSAEFKIPWTSLRIPNPMPEQLTFMVFRNMQRETRVRMQTAAIGREPSCFLCAATPLTGIKDIPPSAGFVASPYVTLSGARSRENRSPWRNEKALDAGVDVKWCASSSWVIDGTLLPDFSQLEIDTPPLKGNTGFAQYLPEKRPFFLEGTDLYSMALPAIYTRSMADPRWGARATLRSESLDATVLTVQDRGGGALVVPGTYFSTGREQPSSQVTLARARAPFKFESITGSTGALFTHRDYKDGTRNTVAGLDAVMKPDDPSRWRVQALVSDTRDASLSAGTMQGGAGQIDYFYDKDQLRVNWNVNAYSPKFRADTSLITQTGVIGYGLDVFKCIKREGFFYEWCPGFGTGESRAWDGTLLSSGFVPTLYLNGNKSTEMQIRPNYVSYSRVREGGLWHHVPQLQLRVEGVPSETLSYVAVNGNVGRGVDYFADALVNQISGDITIAARPHPRIELEFKANAFVLRDIETKKTRLNESVLQIVGVGFVNAQDTLRVIGQHTRSARNLGFYAADLGLSENYVESTASLVATRRFGLGKEVNIGLTARRVNVPDAFSNRGLEGFVKVSWSFAR
jgi:Domain of unknown function (DUF5916)/Carbohydrate family 9 binding domain-like